MLKGVWLILCGLGALGMGCLLYSFPDEVAMPWYYPLPAFPLGLLLIAFGVYVIRGDTQTSSPPLEPPASSEPVKAQADTNEDPLSWGASFKFRLKVVTVLMAVMCPALLIGMYSTAKRQFDSYQWPETAGVVESTTAKPWLDDKKVTKYFGRVVYTYTVNDQKYTSDLTDLGPGAKRINAQAALADVEHYRPGDKVAVYYDPNDPTVAVVEKGIPAVEKVLLTVLAVGSLVSTITSVFIIRSWLPARRTPTSLSNA